MREGVCTEVLNGDTIVLDGGHPKLRYSNVWAPVLDTPLGQAITERNKELVLGKAVQYVPNGHIHWDNESIVAEVYVDGLWLNQELRFWLTGRVEAPQWIEGIPGPENTPERQAAQPQSP